MEERICPHCEGYYIFDDNKPYMFCPHCRRTLIPEEDKVIDKCENCGFAKRILIPIIIMNKKHYDCRDCFKKLMQDD